MQSEHKYLLHLLGAYLREEEPEAPTEVDWAKLVHLAHIHNLIGILGYMSMSYPICPNDQRKTALRQSCRDTIVVFSQRAAMAELFCRELERNEIDHILMKGYVLRDYYPVPELRTFGDIDIVIRPQDREKCHSLMLEQGFQVKTDWGPVFSYFRGNEYYEIHTDIMEIDVSTKADYRKYFQNMWRHAKPIGPHSYQFTPEFHFLYLLTHIAKHIHGSGAGLRMYLDVAVFIRHFKDTIDWNFVRNELKKLQLLDFAGVVLSAVESWFGLARPFACKEAEPDILEAFAEFTLAGGVFGHYGRDNGTISLKNQGDGGETVSRTSTFVKRLFPSAKNIESRYTYLRSKPWLLPAAWVHRLIITKDTWRSHMEEARNIFTADTEEVLKLRRLYEEIGL